MKKILAAILVLASSSAFAADNYIANITISAMSVRGANVLFGVSGGTPANVCNHYGYLFNLDISTTTGKNLYSALLTAKLTGSKVNITYTESTTPGVDYCLGENVAKPWVIDIL